MITGRQYIRLIKEMQEFFAYKVLKSRIDCGRDSRQLLPATGIANMMRALRWAEQVIGKKMGVAG